MKTIIVDLPKEIKSLDIVTFADEHIGDINSDIQRVKERIEKVKNSPNTYCILNGDILDFACRNSIGDIESRKYNIMSQLQLAIDLFEPIKDKILAITDGNHEARGYIREGVEISRFLAMQLGISDRYTPASAMIFLSFGYSTHLNTKIMYTIYVNHGRGGGRKEGSKILRLTEMASIVDADIYIHSHTHLPAILKEAFYRVVRNHKRIEKVDKIFVNTASNLEYGGYGEIQEYKPSSMESPVIHLSGTKRKATATL